MKILKILTENTWQIRCLSGKVLSPKFTFEQNGNILGSAHHNEAYWKYESRRLQLLSNTRIPTSEYTNFYNLGGENYQFLGTFLLDSNRNFILESQGKIGLLNSNIALESSIGKNTNKIIIQFNSAGTPFNQDTLEREFNTLTNLAGQNIIRISQTHPPFWYTNFIHSLTKILSGFISDYKEVFILGSSAGGYATLIMGEILSSLHPNINFVTFSINAKTTFDEQHINFLKKTYNEKYFSSEIMDSYRLSHADCASTNIIDYLKIIKNNISHHVFYDIYNPVEKYHYELISSSKRINLHSFQLGLNHGDGCIHIGNSDLFKERFLSLVNDTL